MDLIDRLREYASTRKGELAELITEAADALEGQPCEDAINRADAIRVASGYCHPANVAKELAKLPAVHPQQTCEYWDSESKFCALCRPSVQPQRKTGKWIYTPTEPLGYICSECKKGCCRYNYCPNCGAKMEVNNESN